MNRTHAEPERVKPSRCPSCGLPYDERERQRLEQRCANSVGWALCPECLRETCRELRRVCAEDAESVADLAAAKTARLLRSLAVAVLLLRRPEVEAHLLAHPETLHDVRGYLNTLGLVAQRLGMLQRGEG